MRTIIGLTGYAGSGKDEAAKALVAKGFVRVGFADILKEVAYKLNPIIWFEVLTSHQRLADIVDRVGWDEAKRQEPEIRKLLQRLGTEAGREVFGDSFWVERAFDRINKLPAYTPVVITDVRFPNEANAIRYHGGKVYRIHRPGVDAVNNHASDTGIRDLPVDDVIWNDETIDMLHRRILTLAAACEPTKQICLFDAPHKVSINGNDVVWGKDA